MEIILNGKLFQPAELHFDLQNRAFMYGDGLFETIMVKDGKICLLNLHIERLLSGMKILSMKVPREINEKKLAAAIHALTVLNGSSKDARVKLQVWRQSGGLYTPLENKVNTLISTSMPVKRSPIIKKAAFSRNVQLHYTAFSALKTCNALPYVMAGVEKKARGLDEIILLDNHGNLSECSSSNLFWIKNNILYTPALTTGCISGVMRKHILQQAALFSRKVKEVAEKPATLSTADQVFCCNVTGIYFFEKIENTPYKASPDPEIAKMIGTSTY